MPERAALITVLIINRPLCTDCIANKTGMSVRSVKRYLAAIPELITTAPDSGGRCRACGMARQVSSLPRPR
jgi:hypothetical protein